MLLQLRSAIALAARPRLLAILIPAFGAVMRILHLHQLEILLPIRPLFLQRRGTETDFHPADAAVAADAGVGHVAEVFIARHRAAPKGLVLDGAEQVLLLSLLHTRGDQITHKIF